MERGREGERERGRGLRLPKWTHISCPLSVPGITWRGKTQKSPLTASAVAVSFPMPVLAPVMRTVFPSRLTVDLHTPPAAYFLLTHSDSDYNSGR
ncbi:hypothetical protein EYF80_025651 [Liparis tanakae]|uniref:Uncharacterized protein n=1 Tax=Liparis tanakae TaxID=230148 RepID=A0A4Z2HGR1_9TELE|nr:hypothetical protein EYF80_025651 [Liparis tanakae]